MNLFWRIKKVPRNLAILLLYLFIITLTAVGVGVVVPTISQQLMDLVKNMPGYIKEGKVYIQELSHHRLFEWLSTQTTFPLKQLKKCN
ncbi:AI-2E family transporter [Bacillus cereus]